MLPEIKSVEQNTIPSKSLYQVVMDTAGRLFAGEHYSVDEKAQVLGWILDHTNRVNGFIFYPTPEDRQAGIRLFSGEKPRAKFLINNMVELETLRLLALLAPDEPRVRQIFQHANQRLLPLCFANGCTVGECAHATLACIRYLAASQVDNWRDKTTQTLAVLKNKRLEDGRWHGFPYYFTLLWLVELPADLAREELNHTRACAERLYRRMQNFHDSVGNIRKRLLQKVLSNESAGL